MAVEAFDPADIVSMMAEDLGRDIAGDLLDRPGWQRDSLCIEYPELTWVPPNPEQADADAACTAVCARCLVRRECLTYAMADASLVGTWGGTGTRERRRLRAALRAA